MLPAVTRAARGRQSFQRRKRRSLHSKIRLEGQPRSSSTGEMWALSTAKLRMVVNTRVLAKPHSPLIKKAQTAAVRQIIGSSRLSNGCAASRLAAGGTEDGCYMGRRFRFSRSTIQAMRRCRPASVFASK